MATSGTGSGATTRRAPARRTARQSPAVPCSGRPAPSGRCGPGVCGRLAGAHAGRLRGPGLHRRHPGGAQPARRLRRAVGRGPGRRPGVPRGAAHDRRPGLAGAQAGQPVRAAPGPRPAPAAVRRGTLGRRARRRPAEPEPVALRRHGGHGEGGARVEPAHRVDRPDGRAGRLRPARSPPPSWARRRAELLLGPHPEITMRVGGHVPALGGSASQPAGALGPGHPRACMPARPPSCPGRLSPRSPPWAPRQAEGGWLHRGGRRRLSGR